jgi:MFS family permease
MGLFESGRMLTGVIHAFFLISRGVSLQQLAILQIVSSTTVVLLSIPIGIFADVVSRKLTTLIALFFVAAFYYLCLFAPSLPLLILAKIFYATGLSAVSYAAEAWALDTIFAEYPGQPHMANYFGHFKKEIASFGNMFAGILGSMIAYTLGYYYLYLFSMAIMFLLVLGFGLTPTTKIHYKKPRTSILETTLSASKALFFTQSGLFYLSAALLIIAVYQPVYYFWQPLFIGFFKDNPMLPAFFREPIPILGLTFVCVNAVILLLNYGFRKHMIKKLAHFNIGTLVAMSVGLCFLVLGMNSAQNPWLSLLAFGLIHGFLTILSNIATNQYAIKAPQEHLASIFSFSYLVQCLLSILVLVVIKQVVNPHNLGVIFASCSLPMLVLGLVLLIGRRMNRSS